MSADADVSTIAGTKTPRSKVRLALTWLVRLVLMAFLAVVLACVAILIVIPRMSHGTALDVLTGSMTPDIPIGSIVVDRPVDPGTLHVGDIATYQVAPGVNEYITHRIIKIDTSTTPITFVFKGDANRGPDIKPVPSGAIRGKVWFHVPYLGSIRDGLKGGMGRSLLLLLATLGLAGFAVKQLADAFRERKRRPRAPDAATGCNEPQESSLVMSFDRDAFGEADPSFVAQLLQGGCEVVDETVVLAFVADRERLAVVRELLTPYGVEIEPESAVIGDDAESAVKSDQPEPGGVPEPDHGLTVSLVKSAERAPIHA